MLPQHVLGWSWSERILSLAMIVLVSTIAAGTVRAQVKPADGLSKNQLDLPAGFIKLEGKYVTIVTDLPASESIKQLPEVFDAAMPHWAKGFEQKPATVEDWHVTGYLMGNRQRFTDSGLLPPDLPPFSNGYQRGDEFWFVNQSSEYYRQHLMLHEGTHWFMYRAFGGAGSPWYMEGIAERFATHRYANGLLEVNTVPANREEVPGWGRIKLIRDGIASGNAPSLDAILNYSSTAHVQVEAYAWSWAAVLFFQSHPDSAIPFDSLRDKKLDYSDALSKKLKSRLRSKWPQLTASWAIFANEIDYGFDPTRCLAVIQSKRNDLKNGPVEFSLATNHAWQDSGLFLRAGDKVSIHAEGEFQLEPSASWKSQPQGVTFEYLSGQPFGKLVAIIAPPADQKQTITTRLEIMPVGRKALLIAPVSGALLFKINDYPQGFKDNKGELKIRIEPGG